MITIRLRKGEWKYNPKHPLGSEGGFGEVFLGESAVGKLVAVKRLKIAASTAAHRELKIADWIEKKTFSHIMPCYDSGQDSESDMYFVVMPQAELSLDAKIKQEGVFGVSESAGILLEIVNGLIEAGGLVHRDIKPGNILYYESSWYIADFGIAMFVEESTSLRTLKGCLTHLFHFNELVLTKSHYYRNCENKIVCFQYVKNETYRFSQCSAIKYK